MRRVAAPKWVRFYPLAGLTNRIIHILSDSHQTPVDQKRGAAIAVTTGTAIIALLGAMSAFGPLSMDMYLPSLPTLAGYFSTSTSKAQLTLSGFTIGFAVGQLVYGPVSDRFGRKWVLISGVALYVLASCFCATSTDVEMLILVRFLQAYAGGKRESTAGQGEAPPWTDEEVQHLRELGYVEP